MARANDYVSSSRETSPDPITLPSSPLAAHSGRKTSVKPSPRKINRRSATPSKSVMLDTPRVGNESPWRIKVTVEAEPREGSPGKRNTRTTSIPLKDSTSKRSSSPTKRASAQKANAGEVKRPARKRKGTPLRDTRPARPNPQAEPTTEEDDVMPERSHSPARRASGRLARLSAQPGSAHLKRLSSARDELDWALQDAVGYSDNGARVDAPGDMTTSKNEDFSMISMESLQSAKETSMSNVMQTIPEGEKSAATVSYMDSSPPKPRYPNIQHKAERARSSLGQSVANAYDPMSWKPTGILKNSSPSSTRKQQERQLSNERRWQKQRESVSQQVDSARPEDVVMVEDAQEDVQEDHEQGAAGVDEDIWQDEASRSLEDNQGSYRSRKGDADQPKLSPHVQDLFADMPLKPLRSKIPRTWRRSSGMDFSYVDSPAHEPPQEPEPEAEDEPEDEPERQPNDDYEDEPVQTHDHRHSTDGSGVLTPPSTEDSEEEEGEEDEEDVSEDEEYEESEFAPEAEATRVQDVAEEDGAATPGSDEDPSSPDGEDTGNFFQTNLPQVYMRERPRRRPPRQKTMDLTELLNLDGANSPVKPAVIGSKAGADGSPKVYRQASSSQAKHSPLKMQPINGKIKISPNEQGRTKLIDSPLRKSLLKSSKMHESAAPPSVSRGRTHASVSERRRPDANHSHYRSLEMQDAKLGDSFQSKESDQRQLLSEAAAEEQEHSQHYHDDYEDEDDEMVDDAPSETGYQPYAESEEYYEEDEVQDMDGDEEEYYEEDEVADPSRSYEERLNLDSPQKIQVNFNDSKTSSSWLADKKKYPPLFDLPNAPRYPQAAEQSVNRMDFAGTAPRYSKVAEQPSTRMDSSDTITLVDKNPEATSTKPGFFSCLSTTFWNAVVGPPVPTEPLPTQEELTALFSSRLRSQIRSRYGVVSEEFPWTYVQMRTLQRMLNSLTSNRVDSIIPRSGPLPPYLEKLVGTYQPGIIPAGYKYLFTEAHAYVVLSFFQVTVSRHLIEAMRRGEVETLGDGTARGIIGKWGETYGDQAVFPRNAVSRRVANWVESHTGVVQVDFVVRALGTCIDHNEGFERQFGLPFEEIQRRDLLKETFK